MVHRVLVTDEILESGLQVLKDAPDVEVEVRLGLQGGEIKGVIADYDAIITRSGTALDEEFFKAAAGHLKIAARAGVGLDNIDVLAATTAGVMVMNIPEVNALAAAEHAMALLLSLCRKVPQSNASLRSGNWNRQPFMGIQLAGKTLGIIGLGRVGRLVAVRALAFGMNVISFDPYIPVEMADSMRVELVEEMDELLARADFISLHTQLTDETNRLLGEAEIARMKPGVRIINTARGALIDEAALLKALVTGQVAGAGLDVYSVEPVSGQTGDLIRHPAVVATPHLGASTYETQEDVSMRIVQQVLDALRGTGYHNVVNLPFAENEDYREVAPYMLLAEKIGSLHMQLELGKDFSLSGMHVEVAYRGEDLKQHTKPLAVALLKGLLTPILGDSVNYVNAPKLAQMHGLSLHQTVFPGMEDYANVIVCRVATKTGKRLLAGTLLTRSQPRIVRLDDIPMDALPSGFVLVIKSKDTPGVIGKVASHLGSAGLNIAEYRVGRDRPGGTNFSFVNLDSEAPQQVLEELRALPLVVEVKQVCL
ncbi:MAG: phosphoglycerate dehydrogenase [Anaerolineales bacterium]|nr:phosphoglycerate dehydrogenase [Anaerolineales bacterium]